MELLNELNKYYPDDRTILIEEVDFKSEIPYVIIRFKYVNYINEKDWVDQRWQVNLKGFKVANVSSEPFISVEFETEHALLWEHQDPLTNLYFSGVPADIFKLYWDLTQVHNELFENYVEVDRFLNHQDVNFDELLKAGAGLFAKGPQRLMSKYAELLEKHSVKTNMLYNRELNLSPLTVMFIGKTYIVAEEFDSIKLM
ncbi:MULTISPECIES: hypothetical protein [unclassified Chitinophaga]|uniref:hypothetical protein n=1 Tax=unclassified Chitinophaga TaxID=2619133 RepID=UPI0009CA62F4|nr:MULTISPECIES: hypothetical protein [unclassified Chitinophaga]OMP75153.1 hypothetical protein BW716_31635 [[Flexibacter] sp. ATCC 35208]WPV63879.1 hypothetical protein QQL36_18945 [Chitinophaga sp. LS1]